MGQEPESSHCFQSLFTNPEIRWSQKVSDRVRNEVVDFEALIGKGDWELKTLLQPKIN